MANEVQTPTVLIAHFPEARGTGSSADERRVITEVLAQGIAKGEFAVFDAGTSAHGAVPIVNQEGFQAEAVNLLHLSGQPFRFGDTPLGSQERQEQEESLKRLTESILHYPEIQLVLLSGSEHEELARQLLLMGVPMVLSLKRSPDLPEQVEAFFTGLAAGQSVRQTLEILSDAYPEWELSFYEIGYDPEAELLRWDSNRYPEGPDWSHGLIYRESQWRSLTWRLRNPLVIPIAERRRWERRKPKTTASPNKEDGLKSPLLSTPKQEAEESNDLAVRGRSRALRRGAQKSREIRERHAQQAEQQRRRRVGWVIALGVAALLAVGVFLGRQQMNRGEQEEVALLPCPFPQETESYRVLLLPIKETPSCQEATYLSDPLILQLKNLRTRGVKIDIRYQSMDPCPLTEQVVQTTADLCYADLVLWGNYLVDTVRDVRRLNIHYQHRNRANEDVFIQGAGLRQQLSGSELDDVDSLLASDLVNLVLWGRANQHFNQEEYDAAIRSLLAISSPVRGVQSLVTQMLTRSYVQSGEYQQAREYFGRLIDMHPDESSYYLDRANMLTLMEEPSAALEDLNRVLQMEPDNMTAQVRRAAVHQQLGQFDQALADIDQVLLGAPDLPVLHCRRAEVHLAQGAFDLAEDDYQEALRLDPAYAEAHYGLGTVWRMQGKDTKALAAIDEALRYDPDLVEAKLFRADMLADRTQWAEAIDAYATVIAQQASPEAHTRRGFAYEALGQQEEALLDFKQATRLQPTNTEAWMGRARIYAGTDRYEAALADVNRVLSQQPRNQEALRLRAEIHLIRQDWTKALADLTQLIEDAGGDQTLYFFQALAHLELGEIDKAAEMTTLAYEAGENSNRFRLLDARVRLAQDKPTEALQILESIVQEEPSWGEAFHFRGLAHLALGDEVQAQEDLEKAAALGGEQQDTYLMLGGIYQEAGSYDAAKQAFDAFIEEHPERVEGYLRRAALNRVLFRFDSALADFDRAFDLDPDLGYPHHLARGEVRTQVGQYNLALVDLNQALRQEPDHFMTYCLRGELYQKMRNPSQAESDLERAASLAPANPIPFVYLGRFYRDQDRWEQALRTVNQALTLDSTFAKGYNLRGELWIEQRRFERAIADFNRAIELDPTLADAYDNRADLARQGEDYARAIADYSSALQHNPWHADARYYRGFLYALQGKNDQAISDILTSLEIEPKFGVRYGFLAQIYARERMEDPFFQYLQLAVDHGYPLSELKGDPAFRYYRDHPRFQRILQAYGQ